jgi:GAF domain-containing protein
MPILIGDEVVGTLGIDLIEPHQFTPGELSLVQNVADQVGQSLDRVRLFIAAREHAARMARLAHISADLNRSVLVAEVLENIGKGALSLNEASWAVVYLKNPDGSMSCHWSHGVSQNYIIQALAQWQEPFIQQLHNSQDVYVISDLSEWQAPESLKSLMESEGIIAAGYWPLRYEGQELAVIGCYYNSPHIWTDAQLELCAR